MTISISPICANCAILKLNLFHCENLPIMRFFNQAQTIFTEKKCQIIQNYIDNNFTAYTVPGGNCKSRCASQVPQLSSNMCPRLITWHNMMASILISPKACLTFETEFITRRALYNYQIPYQAQKWIILSQRIIREAGRLISHPNFKCVFSARDAQVLKYLNLYLMPHFKT